MASKALIGKIAWKLEFLLNTNQVMILLTKDIANKMIIVTTPQMQ